MFLNLAEISTPVIVPSTPNPYLPFIIPAITAIMGAFFSYLLSNYNNNLTKDRESNKKKDDRLVEV